MTRFSAWGDTTERIFISGHLNRTDMTPPEWRDRDARTDAELKMMGAVQPFEKEYFRKDGGRVPVLIGLAASGEERDQGVAFVLDLSERKRAEAEARESERRYREVQMELAHANRVGTMGHLTASIAHEVIQPISATSPARRRLCAGWDINHPICKRCGSRSLKSFRTARERARSSAESVISSRRRRHGRKGWRSTEQFAR